MWQNLDNLHTPVHSHNKCYFALYTKTQKGASVLDCFLHKSTAFCAAWGSEGQNLAFLDNFEILREQNREDWEVVRQTISHDEETKDYDYYFDFVKNLIEPFRTHEDKKDSSEDQIQ